MVTIQDVAKAAGVSAMTVSHVINDHPHVKSETRERVLRAIADLDYRVNVAARNLRTGRTGTIGLAVPEVDRPYYGHLAAAIIAAAARHNLKVAIEQTGASREGELAALALSRNRLYDGLILSTVGLGPADTDLLKVDYPMVILGERIFDGPVDHVAMPNVEGARAATAHLIERGCRRIALIDGRPGDDVDVSGLRYDGYREALEEAGIPIDPRLLIHIQVLTMEEGAAAARRLSESGVEADGVFCVTDTVAIGALRGFADAGVRVPQDIKVIGFDNIAEGAYSVPSLSSIDPDHPLMASTAVRFLVGRLAEKGKNQRVAREFISRFTVVARESTG
ncbi:LacI family DNA-binding transcriptional regulator [Nonomuraea basaltis]|uniref:LacI family DNA-binding transcriptional regulator n=1 Tax=Nonomuraea basaltis TaxID=2495887 RepID=UPI00110C43BC|nr:LacI family DNA-binding transcriptional regulator [Nonomuraea basaltis]TMR94518.1 LacI family transcriptional regulator [Nonomuraea basaltis]